MTKLIEVFPERGEIRVGGDTFDCDAHRDGSLGIGGIVVRPITLAERQQLVGLLLDDATARSRPSSDGRAARLAGLIGDLASAVEGRPKPSTGSTPSDVPHRSVLDAVALYLAGATLPGALLETTVMAIRSMGPSAALAMEARLADEVAAALVDGIRGRVGSAPPGGADLAPHAGGWTTIDYEPPAGDSTEVDAIRLDARAVSVLLAERLLARSALPIDGQLAAELVSESDEAPSALDVSGMGGVNAPGTARSVGATREHLDRWGAALVDSASSAAMLGDVRAERRSWVGDEVGGLLPAHAAARRADQGIASNDDALAHAAAGPRSVARRSTSEHSGPLPLTTSAASPMRPGGTTDRHPTAAEASTVHMPFEGDRALHPGSPRLSGRAGFADGEHRAVPLGLRRQPLATGAVDATSGLGSARVGDGATVRTPRPATRSTASTDTGAERNRLDIAAAALHRAADLRGVPR